MLGIYTHNMKDQFGRTDYKGKNPFDNLYITKNGRKIYLSSLYRSYDWVNDNGYENLGNWIEKAAKDAGR